MGWRQRSAWAVAATAAAFVLLVAAWLAANWNDAPAALTPAELRLPVPSLPDARNAYFAFAGLLAASDRDPAVAGQALWKQLLARPRPAASSRFVPDHDTPPVDVEGSLGKALPGWSGAPIACESAIDDCVARWIAAPDALRAQRDEHAVIGTRCERLVDGDFAFDELLAPMTSTAVPVAQHAIGAYRCAAWFTSGAVLAWVQRDSARAIELLAKADRMHRALIAGSHSLIGQMMAIRIARDTFAAASTLAVRDPDFAAASGPLLAPLPDAVPNIRRWMAVEAAFQRGAIVEIEQIANDPAAAAGATPWSGGALGAWLFRRHIGWHPQRTMQMIDAWWLRSMQPLEGGLAAAIGAQAAEAADAGSSRPLLGISWVNPVGSVLVDVGRPAYGSYLTRHADLELQREVVALAVAAASARVSPADRAAWTNGQPLASAARERIAWSDDGLELRARTWLEAMPASSVAPRDEIRVRWPGAR